MPPENVRRTAIGCEAVRCFSYPGGVTRKETGNEAVAVVESVLCVWCVTREHEAFSEPEDVLCIDCAPFVAHCQGCDEPFDWRSGGVDDACDDCLDEAERSSTRRAA
jgi:hypothetical protein